MANSNTVQIFAIVIDNRRESTHSPTLIMARELLMAIPVALKTKAGTFNYKVICSLEFWLKIEWNTNTT